MKYRLFVVEDHPLMLEMLVAFIQREPDLELCGEAKTALEALDRIPASAPDLVLVDVSLPGMNGIELVEQLRARHPGLPALVISGHDESVYAAQAFRAGAQGYIMKGDIDPIVTAIQQVLSGQLYFSDHMRRTLQL